MIMIHWQHHKLEDATDGTEGAGGGDGGAAAGTALTGDAAVAAAAAAAGKAGDSGGDGVKVVIPDNWKEALAAEYRDEPCFKAITNVESLAKSYIHSQKQLGDKLVIPNEYATDDEWRNVFQKLGLPEDTKGYGYEHKEGSVLDADMVNSYLEEAHKFGVLPKQATGILEWFQGKTQEATDALATSQANESKADMDSLKTEWGNAYDKNVNFAKAAFKKFGDEKSLAFMEDSKLGDNPHILKLFAAMGQTLKEDEIPTGGSGGLAAVMTPADAQTEINKVLGDTKHPYNDNNHPEHKQAVQDMNAIFEQAHPVQSNPGLT